MKISYVISHGVADWVDCDGKNDGTLTLEFAPKHDGTLTLGTLAYPVKRGEVSLPVRIMRDGEHYPKLECSDGVIKVCPFTKLGTIAVPNTHGSDSINRLIRSNYELECKLTEALAEIKRLTQKCEGYNIFNFERKEI